MVDIREERLWDRGDRNDLGGVEESELRGKRGWEYEMEVNIGGRGKLVVRDVDNWDEDVVSYGAVARGAGVETRGDLGVYGNN